MAYRILKYRTFQPLYPSPGEKEITGLSSDSTIEDISKEILKMHRISAADIALQLFLPNGVPLNWNKITAQWTLKNWQFRSSELLLVVFCKKQYSDDDFQQPVSPPDEPDDDGMTHLSVKGVKSCTIRVDQNIDTCLSLYQKICATMHIPMEWISLLYQGEVIAHSDEDSLDESGLREGAEIILEYLPKRKYFLRYSLFDANRYTPLEPQTEKGMSLFLSVLLVVSHYIASDETDLKVLGLIMKLTACPPLVLALALLFDRRMISTAQRIAIHEGLYNLFKAMLPATVPKNGIYEHSRECWAHLITSASADDALPEDFDHCISLLCDECSRRLDIPKRSNKGRIICYTCSQILQEDFTTDTHIQRLLVALPLDDEATYWDLVDPNNWPDSTLPKQVAVSATQADRIPYLRIRSAQDLKLRQKENPPPCLTYNGKMNVVVFTERSKDTAQKGMSVYLFDPITGNGHDVNYEIQKIERDQQAIVFGGCDRFHERSYITEAPDEAIVVLLDVSYSMGDAVGRSTRLEVAKKCFKVFAERTIAHGYKHAVGLTTFDDKVKHIFKLSEAAEAFIEILVNKSSRIQLGGSTAMWDAMIDGCNQLDEVRLKYPTCTRRLLCLSDGGDNASRYSHQSCVSIMKQKGVKMDFIAIGSRNDTAKWAALSTGGYCFHFTDITQVEEICEREPLLSSALRAPSYGNDYTTSQSMKILAKPQLQNPVTTPSGEAKTYWNEPTIVENTQKKRLKRILREMVNTMQKVSRISIYPIKDHVDTWKILIEGPSGSVYEGGVFLLYAVFPPDYPDSPPEVRFETPIHLCSITTDGGIGLPILNKKYYSPDFTMPEILTGIQAMFVETDPSRIMGTVDSVKANEYKCNPDAFNTKAREMVIQYASKPLGDYYQEWNVPDVSEKLPQFLDEAWFMQD